MSNLKYYVIDTETTGIQADFHETIEISIIRCSDRHQLTCQIKADFPERASPKALEVTGKTKEDLFYGDRKEDVVRLCNAFFEQDGATPEHRCIIGHNASFDKRFCHALWAKCDQTFPAVVWMDTVKMSRLWAKMLGKQPKSFKLAKALEFANIKAMPGAHDAGSDARNTYLLWKKGMESGVDYLQATRRWPHETKKDVPVDLDLSDIH